jgi:hypothetical protein
MDIALDFLHYIVSWGTGGKNEWRTKHFPTIPLALNHCNQALFNTQTKILNNSQN